VHAVRLKIKLIIVFLFVRLKTPLSTSNPKLFWQYFDSKRSTHSLPNSMYYNNDNISSGDDITNCFAQHFSSVFNTASTSQTLSDSYNANLSSVGFNSCTLTISEVFNELNEISYKTCPGLDLISNIFFMQCKFVSSTPLLMLFNQSLTNGVLPDKWKISYATPVFKNGDVNHVINYRPVSI